MDYSYNSKWQLDRIIYPRAGSCTYKYNADGIRTEKAICGKETHKYLLEGNQIIREEILDVNGNWKHLLWYNYDGNGTLTSVEYDGSRYLYKVNQMGDVLGLAGSSPTGGAIKPTNIYYLWAFFISILCILARRR